MARASNILTFPSSSSFKRTFEELPLFSQKAANGEVFAAGLVDGEIEISYSPCGDWWISDIAIKIDNFRMGSAARAHVVPLCPEENQALYGLILDVFSDKYAETIAEWVYDHLQEAA